MLPDHTNTYYVGRRNPVAKKEKMNCIRNSVLDDGCRWYENASKEIEVEIEIEIEIEIEQEQRQDQ